MFFPKCCFWMQRNCFLWSFLSLKIGCGVFISSKILILFLWLLPYLLLELSFLTIQSLKNIQKFTLLSTRYTFCSSFSLHFSYFNLIPFINSQTAFWLNFSHSLLCEHLFLTFLLQTLYALFSRLVSFTWLLARISSNLKRFFLLLFYNAEYSWL